MNTSYASTQPSNPLNNINGVVPDSLKYIHKPSAIPAYSETSVYMPDNGSSFSPNLAPTINLPIRSPPNSFVDMTQSYLMLTIKNTSTAVGTTATPNQLASSPDNKHLFFDSGNVSSIIRTLKILSGGTTISELGNKYHTLASLLLSNNVSDDYLRVQSILGGCAEYDTLTGGPTVYLVSSNNFLTGGTTWADNAGESKTFIVPLISGFLNGSKMLPTHFTANSFITLQIGLTPANEAFIMKTSTVRTSQTLNYEITNVRFFAKTVFLNDSAVMDRITGTMLSEGKLSMCVPEYSNVNIPFTLVGGTSRVNINIPCRYQVLRSILCVMVPQTTSDTDCNTQGSKYGLKSYQYSVGGRNLQVIDCSGNAVQAYCEYLKCFNTLGNVNVSSNCSLSTWNIANANATGAPKRGSFCIAQNFENFAHTDALESGMNTQALSLNINLALEFEGATANDLMMAVFFNYDTIYELYGDSSFIVKA